MSDWRVTVRDEGVTTILSRGLSDFQITTVSNTEPPRVAVAAYISSSAGTQGLHPELCLTPRSSRSSH